VHGGLRPSPLARERRRRSERTWVLEHRSAAETKPKPEIGGRPGPLGYRRWKTRSPQQRNVVLHPRFVEGRYLLYTRPQDGFIDAGSGGGIAWGLTRSMEDARIEQEHLLDPRVYHTIKEAKNGAGAPPIETPDGWLHVAHGVRHTAAGLRYVLYAFLCAADDPGRVLYAPGGYLLAPEGDERIGDVSNVVFSNGLTVDPGGRVLLYYGSSDTRLHVAETTVATLLDYVKNTPPDPLTSRGAVEQRLRLIRKNRARMSGARR
ncbi:MAG: hypothetical protein GX607_16790, partial [Myxococcales bacterium]|nr:hypothetical protein [Myxococcales bacterium]